MSVPLSVPPTSKVVLLFLLSRRIPYLVSADVGKKSISSQNVPKKVAEVIKLLKTVTSDKLQKFLAWHYLFGTFPNETHNKCQLNDL